LKLVDTDVVLPLKRCFQVRASIDYHLDPHQYQIGLSSLFVYALGLVPFKDNFWTTRVQPGNRYSLYMFQ